MQACVLSPLFSISATLFFSLFFFLWCCDVRAYRAEKNCFLALFYSNVPKWLQISLRSFSKKSAIRSWIKKWKCNFWGKKKGNTHTLQTSALLCPFQRDYLSLAYTLSHPLIQDTAVLVIGSIWDKKSFELLSRISEDWRCTELLCFKRACVWACLFFDEAYLRRIHAVTTKEWTKRPDARAKLSFSLQKSIAFFVILVAVAVVGSAFLSWLGWKGDLLWPENFSP